MNQIWRIAFAGGGTGGHLFPALNIAQAFKQRWPSEIIFFGTSKGLESRKVPERGYRLVEMPVTGFQRHFTLKNLSLPWKLVKSLKICKQELKNFKPHLVIGTGGYVMGPVLRSAILLKIPTVIQEQNSFPGFTTRLLANRTDIIFLGYEEATSYLEDAQKLVVSGNPIIKQSLTKSKEEICKEFGLDLKLGTILVFGGSQGSQNINRSIEQLLLEKKLPEGFQLLWQTGDSSYGYFDNFIKIRGIKNVVVTSFIDKMYEAYGIADFAVCRAGAMTLTELMSVALPAILVPLPGAAGNHQFKNAQSLAQKKAALVVKDDDNLSEALSQEINRVSGKALLRQEMSLNLRNLWRSDSLEIIITEIEKLLAQKYKNNLS